MRNSMKKWNKSKYSLVMLLLAVMLATSGCTSIVKEGTELLEEGNYTRQRKNSRSQLIKEKTWEKHGGGWESATGKKKITKRQKRRLEMHFKTVRRKQQPFIICWESVH